MKTLTTILILLAAASANALVIEADAPTKLSNGASIPAEHIPDLRGTLWMRPAGGVWAIAGTTTNNAFRWSVPDPAVGTYELRATAQFLTQTPSAFSGVLTHKVYGVPAPPANLRQWIAAAVGGAVSLIGWIFGLAVYDVRRRK